MSEEKQRLLEKLMEIEAHGRFVTTELAPGYARTRVQRMMRIARQLRTKFANQSLSVLDLGLYQRRPATADPSES